MEGHSGAEGEVLSLVKCLLKLKYNVPLRARKNIWSEREMEMHSWRPAAACHFNGLPTRAFAFERMAERKEDLCHLEYDWPSP
jgi:hypothetical protein